MFIVRRLLAFIPVMIIVALIVFLMLHLSPGDPVAAIAGDSATAEDIARIRAELGLDDPIWMQFYHWMIAMLQGDLGQSYFLNRPVVTLIADRIGPTLSLAGFTIVLTVLISVPLGTWAAYRQGGWVDRALMAFSVLGFSIPAFVLGYCLVWFLGLHLNIFPTQGYVRYDESIEGWISHLILPSITLCCIYIALIARVTRASVAEALSEDYIRTARAKGIAEWRVLLRHGLANAAVPIVTVIGVGIAILIGGVVVTEIVFAIPGLGSLTIDAVMSRDYPLIQGITLFFSMLYMFINLVIDLSYTLFDPRIRY
ncbi:ABC transporter permease [Sutterella sp.]|uniref:ABC transporter permease n=1 Tax=Sutterella sp. TaxID=1981025 RepID=UPI0026E0BAE9|nr:ABC transporter permease [Sutterella sp.]MDO5532060.1 ABC transporter permease [Sutterella sp.]